MKKILSSFTAVICLLQFSSCATIISGNKSPLIIRSEPSGAEVLIDGVSVGRTPLFADIRRMEDHEIRLMKAGFVEASQTTGRKLNAWAAGNVIFGLFGIFGLLVDASTGAAFSPKKDEIHVRLTPEEEASLKSSREKTSAAEAASSLETPETSAAEREGAARTKGASGLRPAARISEGWSKTKNLLGVFFRSAAGGTKKIVSRFVSGSGGKTSEEDAASTALMISASPRIEKKAAKNVEPPISSAPAADKTKLRRKRGNPILNVGTGGVTGFIVNAMRGFTPGSERNERKQPAPPETKPVEPPAPAGSGAPFSIPYTQPVLDETASEFLPLAKSPVTETVLKEPSHGPFETAAAVRIVEPRAYPVYKEPRQIETFGAEAELVMPGPRKFKTLPALGVIDEGAEKPLALEESPSAGTDFGMPKGGPLRPAKMVSDLVEETASPSPPGKRPGVFRIIVNPREKSGKESVVPPRDLFIEDPVPLRRNPESEEGAIPSGRTLRDPSAENLLRREDSGGRGSDNGETGAPAYSLVRII